MMSTPFGREHLDGADQCRLGQRVGVDADEERTSQPLIPPLVADRLRGREDVGLPLKVFLKDVPRWPEVPNATPCADPRHRACRRNRQSPPRNVGERVREACLPAPDEHQPLKISSQCWNLPF